MSDVPPELLAWRRRTGADRWDEVWEGVLHMAPSPTNDHQRLVDRLVSWLLQHWAQSGGREEISQVNVCQRGVTEWRSD